MASCIIRIITTGTLLSATGATVGAPVGAVVGAPTLSSLILPLTSLAVSDLGIHYNRKKLLRMVNLLTIYHKNKDNKLKVRESLIVAGIELFKSFEIKFKEATFHNNHEIALIKLAHDAIDRLFNFFNENSSLLEQDDFLSSSNIIKAIILGKSKRYRNVFSMPNRHLGYALDNDVSTKRIYKDTPLLKIVSENKIYSYKRNNSHDISDFRFIFKWEEKADPPIRWDIDNEIILVENRKYTKLASLSESILKHVILFNLDEEEFDHKKQKILFELNKPTIRIEEIYQDEIMDEFREEMIELKKNIRDINSLMMITMDNLNKDKVIQKNEATLQEMNDINGEDEMMSIYNRIKKDIESADNFDIYIPLNAYFDLGLPTREEPFLLFEKVISLIRTNKSKKILLLGESGMGKTSFLIYLTQFILKNWFFSIQNSIIPFYMRVFRLKNKNLRTITSKQLLQEYYKFNNEEIEFLFKKKGIFFCFIFDDIALNLELDVLFDKFFKTFPSSYFIFTAHSLEVFKLIQEELTIINIAVFNELSKIEYIKQYKKINSLLSLIDENEEAIYQRIKAISNLEQLTDKPSVLKIVMEILVPLEKFYQQKEVVTGSEYIDEDLFHIYTHVLYRQMVEKFKFSKGITHIDNKSLYECLLNYTVHLAVLMKEIDVFEIEENLFFSKSVYIEEVFNLKITFEQLLRLKKFFAKNYNPILFKDNDEFKWYKYGYQGCMFMRTYGTSDNISYSFSHKKFLEYFFNFNLLRREKVQKFIDSLEEDVSSLSSLQSFNKECVMRSRYVSEGRSRYSFKAQSRHTSFSDQGSVYPPYSYSGSTSRRTSRLQSRHSSIISKEEELVSRRYSMTSAGHEAKAANFFMKASHSDRGKPSYLIAGHSSSVAEAIDPIAIADLTPVNL